MIDRNKALELLHANVQSVNLRKHCLAVAATMKALAKHFNEDENLWEIVGILHDADYEKYPTEHPRKIIKELENLNADTKIINAIAAHAWGYNEMDQEPKNNLEWSIYTCDELTGLIVAVTLVRPEKKINLVTPENILSKWNQKGFAAGVNRKQIGLCEEKLGVRLPEFIEIVLKAMQEIGEELGL